MSRDWILLATRFAWTPVTTMLWVVPRGRAADYLERRPPPFHARTHHMAAPQSSPSSKRRNSTSQDPITANTLAGWANAGRTYRYPCGDGLYFQTRSNSASWVLRFRLGGARKHMGLGAFPEVDLVAARERAGRAQLAIRQGRDPVAERVAARRRFVRELPASDGGVGGAPRPMTLHEAVVRYGDPDDKAVWRNAKGDIKNINENLSYSMLTRTLVREELFRRGFPTAGRVRLGEIPPAIWAFPADPSLPPLTVALLKVYHRDYLGRGDTATALVLSRLAISKAATKLWQHLQQRKRPPLGSDDEDEPDARAYVRPTLFVDLYRDPDTRPDLLRLVARASNVSVQEVEESLRSAADHESYERKCIIAQLLAELAERATRPDDGTIAEIERWGREFLKEERAAEVLREHGLSDQAALHTRQAVKHLWCAGQRAKEWSPNAKELIRMVRWGAVSWQIAGLGNVGGIAADLVEAALNQRISSRWFARRRVKSRKDRPAAITAASHRRRA